MQTVEFLEKICFQVHIVQKRLQAERKRDRFGNQFMPELMVIRKDTIRVELCKEDATHDDAYLHILHSDKIDIAISVHDLSIVGGKIDPKTFKLLLRILVPKHEKLQAIALTLTDEENMIGAEKIIEII